MKTRVAGRDHALTIRDVKLSEAGEVKLTSKDFQTQAQLIVRGQTLKHTMNSEHNTPGLEVWTGDICVVFINTWQNVCFCVQSHQWSLQSLWRTRRWRRKPRQHSSVKFPERMQRYDGSEKDRRSERRRSTTRSSTDARESSSSKTALRTTPRCTRVTPKSSRLPVSWRLHVRPNLCFILFYFIILSHPVSWPLGKVSSVTHVQNKFPESLFQMFLIHFKVKKTESSPTVWSKKI